MAVAPDDFSAWLAQADISQSHLTAEQQALLSAVYRFRQNQGSDYYSTRLLSHFLLHADTGLKVAEVARLVGISRPNASKQQKLSSKEAIAQAHHRMDGRPHGKLLPRYVGPIAAFLLGHPDASRAELLDFIKRIFGVQVSRIALYKFLKKYGLQEVAAEDQPAAQASAAVDSAAGGPPQSPATPPTPGAAPGPEVSPPGLPAPEVAPLALPTPATESMPLDVPAPAVGVFVPSTPLLPFVQRRPFSGGRSTPAPSC